MDVRMIIEVVDAMAGFTVSASDKVLLISVVRRDKSTIGIVTAEAVNVSICTRQNNINQESVIMTSSTTDAGGAGAVGRY